MTRTVQAATSAAPLVEEALVFGCEGDHLVAVLTRPPAGADEALAGTALLIIVGGPQYRAGSHRQYVQLARAAATAGATAMRFDTRGMGDSTGAQRTLEEIEYDLAAAVDALVTAAPHVKRVALWGLCGGASAALLHWRQWQDSRVQGMVLVNPWVRSEETLARTRVKHYYLKRLQERSFWAKLFSGRVAGQAVAELVANLRMAARAGKAGPGSDPVKPAQQVQGLPHAAAHVPLSPEALARDKTERSLQLRMAQAWAHFTGPKLLVLSGNDYTAKEFLETAQTDALWRSNLHGPGVQRLDLAEADHTFSTAQTQQTVEQQTVQWLRSWAATPAVKPAAVTSTAVTSTAVTSTAAQARAR
jgi:uncharacterized protein